MYTFIGRVFCAVWFIGVGACLEKAKSAGEWPYGPWKGIKSSLGAKRQATSDSAPTTEESSDEDAT